LLGAAIAPWPLAPDEEVILEALDAEIAESIEPAAATHDAAGRYPTASIEALRRSGILGIGVPESYGGTGSSHRATLEAQVRLGAADSAVAQVFKVHDELVREIFVYSPAAVRAGLAGRILDDGHVLGLAVAEAGKRVDQPWSTVALPDGDGWRLDGTKVYTTGAAEADEIATWSFDPAAPGIDENPLLGFRLFLIPRGTPGVEVRRDWDALGQRATDSGTVVFTGVRCAPEWRASEPGAAPLPQSAVRYQAGFAAVLVGIGIGALRAAAPFVAARSRPWPSPAAAVVGESAADDPVVQRLCGELAAELVAAYHATMVCGGLLDAFERGEISRADLAVPIYAAKAMASRAAVRTTSEIYALMGTRAAMRENGFDRWWRNARTLSLHDPVDWKHVELGRHLLCGWEPPPGIYT